MEYFKNIMTILTLLEIMKWLIIALVVIVVLYFVIRATCRYQARQNAKAFDYDYLAEKTAAEICKRMMIIERQKETAYKGATKNNGDQSQGDRDGDPQLNESPHK